MTNNSEQERFHAAENRGQTGLDYVEARKRSDEIQRKSHTVVCPKCGRQTSFNLITDAIDEEGEFYRCQHCGWPFHYK